VVAALVLLFGVTQYMRAQAWTRTEFAWKMVDRLTQDEDLAFCRVLIDWSPRRVKIPERYVELMKPEEHRTVFTHSWDKLWIGLTKTEKFSFEEVMYRDLFDAFFSYLDEIERSLATGLVSPANLAGITYWINKVASCKVLPEGPLVFQPFVQKYYPNVESLMRRYEIAWAPATSKLTLPEASESGGPFTDPSSSDEQPW
jgi:hypothetical protein